MGDVRSTGKGFVTSNGVRFGSSGLPSGVAAPGTPLVAPAPPELPGGSWGPYDTRLPYDVAPGFVTKRTGTDPTTATRSVSWFTVPPDGLRWVAAGVLMLVTALLLGFLSRRLASPSV